MNPIIHAIKNRGIIERSLSAPATIRFQTLFLALALGVLFAVSLTAVAVPAIRGGEKESSDPWTSAQIVQPAALVQELENKNGTSPTIVYVGFRTLFAGGHIAGARFHGSTSTEQGLTDFKSWANALPRSTNLVIYCGCCPVEKCPNIRPAFRALDKMGFKKIRVLALPTSFATDWVEKGFPTEKGI